MAELEFGVVVDGEVCRLPTRFRDRDQLVASSWVSIDHPSHGRLWVVPRSHPLVEAPAGAIRWATGPAADEPEIE